jgi:hypothetical protein
MGTPLLHAKSSVRKYGGEIKDYIAIHRWFDSTKGNMPMFKHRAILHNSFGMLLAEQVFGDYVTNSEDKMVEVRQIAYDHIYEDCGFIPTVEDWLKHIQVQPWMMKADESRKIRKEIDLEELKQKENGEQRINTTTEA